MVRSPGPDTAGAVAVASDGAIVVGGRSAIGDAMLARLDPVGRLVERRTIDSGGSDRVAALAFAADGTLVAAFQEGASATLRRLGSSLATDLARRDLGTLDISGMALAADGSVGVAGSGQGGQGGRDGLFVRVDAALITARSVTVGTSGDDRIDSVTVADGAFYLGGRTNGVFGGVRTGVTDAFIARIDASGALADVRQWGVPGETAAAVSLTTALSDAGPRALGFTAGIINPAPSPRLVDQTSLRAGESFSVRLDDGPLRRIAITADDTLQSFADHLSALLGRDATVKTAIGEGGGRVMRIEPRSGHRLDLVAGPAGQDALHRLGLAPTRLLAAVPSGARAPRVRPGGHYGLDLSPVLNLTDKASAALALDRLKSAVSTTQSAFRSLFWDDNKAAIVDGAARKGRVSVYQSAQLGRYQDALSRLGGAPSANLFGQ